MTSAAVYDGATNTDPLLTTTVARAFQLTVANHGEKTAIRTFDDSVSYTWNELNDAVRRTTAALVAYGIGRGDTVAMVLPNTVDCHVIDYAAMHIGAVPFAIFNSAPAEQIAHQLRSADATLVVTQESFLDKVLGAVESLDGQVRTIVTVDGESRSDVLCLADFESTGDPSFDFEQAWRSVEADDLVALIFTSGTTGSPKGAQWTHHGVLAQLRALSAAFPMPADNIVSFLPMAHSGGRISVHYMALPRGATITVCPDLKALPEVLTAVRPDTFFAVPRFWEKIQVAIEAIVQAQPEAERLELEEAIARARRFFQDQQTSDRDGATATYPHDAKVSALLQPILQRVGLDRTTTAFVGGAPSHPELSQFFRAVGVPMLEAYGLTEGALVVFNRLDVFKSGTAGKALPGVELALAEDGELLVKSEFNFAGYRHDSEATAAALDSDGWLHTGDVATIDDNGFVSIVDRKKELIINSAGKNMSPVLIESTIKSESSLIGQVVAIGDSRRYVTALITLDPEAASAAAERLQAGDAWLGQLVEMPAIQEIVSSAVERGNRRLNSNEQIKKYTILPVVWSPDSEELTPTAKLKRRNIHAKYSTEIAMMYATSEP